jgi:hypothetical protein
MHDQGSAISDEGSGIRGSGIRDSSSQDSATRDSVQVRARADEERFLCDRDGRECGSFEDVDREWLGGGTGLEDHGASVLD